LSYFGSNWQKIAGKRHFLNIYVLLVWAGWVIVASSQHYRMLRRLMGNGYVGWREMIRVVGAGRIVEWREIIYGVVGDGADGFWGIVSAAGGQQEEHTVLRSPVMDVVNQNSTEPQAAQRRGRKREEISNPSALLRTGYFN